MKNTTTYRFLGSIPVWRVQREHGYTASQITRITTYGLLGIPVWRVHQQECRNNELVRGKVVQDLPLPPLEVVGASAQPVTDAEREQIPQEQATPSKRKRRGRRTLTEAERELIATLARDGQSQATIARTLGRPPSVVARHTPADLREARLDRPPKPRLEEQRILSLHAAGRGVREIAREVGVAPSTVSRTVAAAASRTG